MDLCIRNALIAAERVARLVIPDIAARPLYIVQPAADSMMTREMIGHRTGCYFPHLDSALRPMLESEGRWQGPGVAIVVDAWTCFVLARDDYDGERAVIGTTLHELAHWLDRPEETEVPSDQYARITTAFAERAERESKPRVFSPDFLSHGESFIRLCAHLWYRCGRGGGIYLRPRWFCFGNHYVGLEMLDSPDEYIAALGEELSECAGLPLRQLAAMEPPREFTALWDKTLERMYSPMPAELQLCATGAGIVTA